jgi:integrase
VELILKPEIIDEVSIEEHLKEKRGRKEVVVIKKKNYKKENDISYFNEAEIKKLIIHSKKVFYKFIYTLLFETGARIEEARAIRFRDVDLLNNKIRIITLKQRSEGDVVRYIPISNELKALLLHHKVESELSNDDFILTQKYGKPAVSRQGITVQLKKDCLESLGIISNVNLHRFRHSRAIFLLNRGVNLVQVQRLLGHSDIRNTIIYLRYADKDFENAIHTATNEFYK